MEFFDIILELLQPQTQEGVDMAIAPLLIAAAAAAPAIGESVGSFVAARKSRKMADEVQSSLDELPEVDFGASSTAQKLADQAYDPNLFADRIANQRSASGTAITQGARGRGTNLSDILRATNENTNQAFEDAQKYSFQATTALGNQEFQSGVLQDQYTMGREDKLENRVFGLQDQANALTMQGIGAAGNVVGSGIGGFAQGKALNQNAKLQNLGIQAQLLQGTGGYEGVLEQLQELMGQYTEDGGMQTRVKMTPGKFSHEENPIDIVHDGEKIGEMTGGEGIVPPDLMMKIKRLIEVGANDELAAMLDQVLSKWEAEADIAVKAREKKESIEKRENE